MVQHSFFIIFDNFFCRSHPNLTFLNSASSFSSSSGRPKQLRHEAKEMVRSLQASRNSLDGAGLSGIINYRFLSTETNLKALNIFRCLFTTSSLKLFVVNVQIFVYNCVFWKKEKQHSQNLSHFENESTFRKRTTFWK